MVFVMIMTTSDDDDDIYDEVYVCHEKSSLSQFASKRGLSVRFILSSGAEC